MKQDLKTLQELLYLVLEKEWKYLEKRLQMKSEVDRMKIKFSLMKLHSALKKLIYPKRLKILRKSPMNQKLKEKKKELNFWTVFRKSKGYKKILTIR
jgi:hypothetical protein